MSADLFTAIAIGTLQGYLLIPIFQVAAAAGEWLSQQWSTTRMPVTTAVNTLVLIAAFSWLDMIIGFEVHRHLARGANLGRVAGGSFTVGILVYLFVSGYEKRFRERK